MDFEAALQKTRYFPFYFEILRPFDPAQGRLRSGRAKKVKNNEFCALTTRLREAFPSWLAWRSQGATGGEAGLAERGTLKHKQNYR